MIDTKEEFLTAAYFTPVDVKPSAKARIEQHLPKNKAGVLKLCNLWKLRMAEAPYGRDKYAAAIRLVRKLASEKMGINVSHDEVEAHYARSIDNKLNSLYDTIRELNSSEQQKTVRLTRAYLLNPTEDNKIALQEYRSRYNLIPRKAEAIQNFLDNVSKNLQLVI